VSIAPDVVKSTIQTSEAPLGIIETTKQIVASRGVRGLFAGVEVSRCYMCVGLCVCVCVCLFVCVITIECVCYNDRVCVL
jgi:hypothetical protein